MLGGGTFVTQNKVLPGTYHNFASKPVESPLLGDRGVVAFATILKWGNDDEIITLTVDDFLSASTEILGYPVEAPEMFEFREVFKHATKAYVYVLGGETAATKASCSIATAKKAGVRGNDLKLVVETNVDDTNKFDVALYLGGTPVFEQTVATISELADNAYVTWGTGELTATAGIQFTGGTSAAEATISSADAHQKALAAFESYMFNVLGCFTPATGIPEVYAAFTKRIRDQKGNKFQCVVPRQIDADYEGVVQLPVTQREAICWTIGALAGCAINQSCTNMTYDGEKTIDTHYTQRELEEFIAKGVFAFHKVYDNVNVLVDINSLVTYTDKKGKDFASNQVIRVNDQCANDTARIFNTKYLGKIQNDDNGRISFWNEIVKHRREMETLRAIETYNSDALVVSKGNDKFSVVVTEEYTPTGSMEKLYITTEI